MSATGSDANLTEQTAAATATPVPKRITNAQTVCNERNQKGKLCNGHLKQLRTAGEPAEVHLRGDDVLSQCQTCGTLYMGPPLGHVRDPEKQHRFVEAELTALLQAAGGTLPVIKRDERGVYVLAEGGGHAAKPAAAKPPAPPASAEKKPATAPAAAKPAAIAAPAAAKPAGPKAEAQPDRQLFKRYTYAGVTDTGPIAGETFEQKVARLKALSAAVKQRADEGGTPQAASAASTPPRSETVPAAVETPPAEAPPAELPSVATEAAPAAPAASSAPKATGQPDRTLFHRFSYCGVVDTGPVPGETFEQKVARLRAVAAAAKQRADEGGA